MFLSYLYLFIYLFIYLGISRHTQIPWVSDKTDLFYTGEVILTSFSIINSNNFPCGHFPSSFKPRHKRKALWIVLVRIYHSFSIIHSYIFHVCRGKKFS